ncbi:MAG TPA: serine/threonine-protein kinase [Polyangiaceae bacterium]|nr:serine/threonine-protein kinase [Polyangiaceae bacterium]
MSDWPRFDGCEVVEKLHTGPLSESYRAVQRPLGRPVLIKAIGASILPSSPFAASLEREARLLAELDHPSIVALYDFVRRDERMWMVLEHVDGWSLEEIEKKVGKLDQRGALVIASEVARALQHAHERGIFHRDVRPRNILVSKRGHVKLANFSVASDERMVTAPELLDHGASYVGPSYMSPEQILGEPSDPRSDLFSLGVVLYELLAGERPFQAPDERNESLRIRSEPPPPLHRRVARISPGIERVVWRCLEKMPSDRFQSAGELLEALAQLQRELGIRDEPETLRRALADAGLAGVPAAPRSAPRAEPPADTKASWSRGAAALLVFSVALIAGATLIQIVSRRGEQKAGSVGGQTRLELVPEKVSYLRVVAHPWAHVVVDGQRVDTTPFAKPIPLGSGTHYVRFEHPNAPVERRTVHLAPGETLLLDVSMKVVPAAVASERPLVRGTDSAADNSP